MTKIDGNGCFEPIIKFEYDFEKNYIDLMENHINNLEKIANDINICFNGSAFGTKSQEQLMLMVKALKDILDSGREELVRERTRTRRDYDEYLRQLKTLDSGKSREIKIDKERGK